MNRDGSRPEEIQLVRPDDYTGKVSDEAIEAAADAIRDLWDSGEPVTPETEARAALEAAAPHLSREKDVLANFDRILKAD